jgi:hypothetical protein
MCRRVQCDECNKPSYAGCGNHVEQVLGDVPREERCSCRDNPKENAKGATEPSILRRIFGL